MIETPALLAIAVTSVVLLVVESLVKRSDRISYWVALLGFGVSLALDVQTFGHAFPAYGNMVTTGGIGSYFSAVILLSAIFTIVFSRPYLQRSNSNYGEWYLLISFAVTGMILIVQAADLIVLFLGIELMSVALYVLAGFIRGRERSNEASLKYFLLGAFATGFLLYGIALVYGASGTTGIAAIIGKYAALEMSTIFWCGIGLLLTGLAFKVGAVPFHMWVPDVYEGSPTPVSGFMATGAKTAAFGALVVLLGSRVEQGRELTTALAVLAAGSMIVGNIVAVAQSNLKRMLAYSSIAHAGYMIAGIASGNAMGMNGVAFYTASYLFMNIGAFGILSQFEEEGESNLTYDDYAGLGSRRPIHAALLTLFMLSLAGIPPFGGFIGKYYIFSAAVGADLTWLAIVGVLTSVVSVFYYLKLVMVMYFRDGDRHLTPHGDLLSSAALFAAALATIVLGVYPSPLLQIISQLF